MIQTIKLKKRMHSNIFDIISSEPHKENSRTSIKLGFLNKLTKTYNIDLDKVNVLLNNGCKINKNLYYTLKHYKINIDSKFIK